jgi:hypothetical protein
VPTRVRLFVSAGPDQEPTREALGRALAELPINVGWVIKRTPDIDSVAECHLFLLLLGPDIWAPVGLELWWARRTEKPTLAYHADVLRTPAGQVFFKENAGLEWKGFANLPALRRQVLVDLSRFLLGHVDRYGLTLPEVGALHSFMTKLGTMEPVGAPAKATGAGGGGIILAPGKDEPPGARLLGDQ